MIWIRSVSISCIIGLGAACHPQVAPRQTAPPAVQALLGCWHLSAPTVEGIYGQISGDIELTDRISRRTMRFPPGLALRLLGDDRDRRVLSAEWLAFGAGEGEISWGDGSEGYNLQVVVVGDSLNGTARGWTDGGFLSDTVRVTGRRSGCS